MKIINAIIRPQGRGESVANLIVAMQFLLQKGAIKSFFDPPNRPTPDELTQLQVKLQQEQSQKFFGEALQKLILYFQIQQGLGDKMGGVVEEATAKRLNELLIRLKAPLEDTETHTEASSVFGVVRDDKGRALAGLMVSAFDRDLRTQELLGSATTDAKGQYQIAYSAAQFSRAEKASADLVVRVLSADGKTELAASDTLFNAPERATVDLTVATDKLHTDSEWERYGRELALPLGFAGSTPALSHVKPSKPLPPQDLTDEDLNFLHGETGIVREHLHFIRQASRWWVAQRKHNLPAEAFYALLRRAANSATPRCRDEAGG